MSLKSLKRYDATSCKRQGDSRKADRHANRKPKRAAISRNATGPSGIEILRQAVIERGKSLGWSKARIVYVIWQHERRCALCKRLLEIHNRP